MVSLNEDFLLGDWGDLFASETVDDCSYGLLKPKDELKVGETLPDLLGDADFQSADQDQDYLGQSEWMTTWTDLLHVPMDPVEEILQQAERGMVEPEVTMNTYKLSNEQEKIVQEILNDAKPNWCETSLDEVPALISFEEATADQFSPLTPPLSPDDIESILSDPSSPLSDVTSSDIGSVSMDDPDWLPYESTTPRKQTTSYTKLRPKPYDKPSTSQSKASVPLSKKERKREQNKNAAIRYREKKRAEAEVVTTEERQLEEKNKSLKNKVESMTNEITYLKDLLREVYKAKGLKLDQKLLL